MGTHAIVLVLIQNTGMQSYTLGTMLLWLYCTGYRYAGLQFGNSCYCWTKLEAEELAHYKQCDTVCPMHNIDVCDSDLHVSVYSTFDPDSEFIHTCNCCLSQSSLAN